MTPPTLVCFDLGGVFIRLQPDLASACRDAGVEHRGGWEHLASDAPRLDLIERYQVGEIDCQTYYGAMSDLSAGRYSPEEIEAIHRVWVIEPYAGLDALLDEIESAGLATACLSNTSHSHWGPLLQIPAIAALGTQHASHLLGLHKPDAAIYQAFENAVGIPGEDIVFFDDLEDNITAARAVGWDAVKIDHASETAPQIRAALEQRGVL